MRISTKCAKIHQRLNSIALLVLCNSVLITESFEIVNDQESSLDSGNTSGVYCKDPGGINHGTRHPEVKTAALYPYEFQLHFSCVLGYTLLQGTASNRTLVCGLDGRWHPPAKPRCRPVLCTRPVVPHGHILNPGPDFAPGTKAQVQCDVGYRLQNKYVSSLECTTNGTWTGHNGAFTIEIPACVEATCPPLPEVFNSALRYRGRKGWDHGYQEGSRANYACQPGYRMVGNGSGESRCHNGSWIGSPRITCERRGCSPPLSIANGEARTLGADKGYEFTVGMSILYVCNPGFALMGSSAKYRCMSDGRWSPRQLPVCRRLEYDGIQFCGDVVPCPPPPGIKSGRISDAKELYIFKDTVTYECHKGFRLVGPEQLTCDSSGQWQPSSDTRCDLNLDDPSFSLPERKDGQERGTGEFGDLSRMVEDAENGSYVSSFPDSSRSSESLSPDDSHMFDMLMKKMKEVDVRSLFKVPPSLPRRKTDRLDSAEGITFTLAVAGCVLGFLFMIFFAVLVTQKRTYCQKLCTSFRPMSSWNGTSATLHEQSSCQDRAALITFADGVQVSLPTYEEAIGGQSPSEFPNVAGDTVPVHRAGDVAVTNCHSRYLMSPGMNQEHCSTGCPSGSATRHLLPAANASSRQSLSMADSMGSVDTVALSEVSTTVTVDTLSSTTSRATPSLNSTQAFCGSLTSFDTFGSGSLLNTEGVPLLEESESEKILDSSDPPSCSIQT